MKDLILLGCGGFAEEIAELATDTGQYRIVAFVESIDRKKCGKFIGGAPVIWITELDAFAADCHLACAVGSTERASFIADAARFALPFATIIHPRAHVSSSVTIQPGVIVGVNAVIGARTRINAHTIVNRGALIGHHCIIDECATIGPGANIGGFAHIESRVYIGMGAQIRDRLRIGKQAVIGAGAVVIQAVPSRTLVVGVPARPIKSVDG